MEKKDYPSKTNACGVFQEFLNMLSAGERKERARVQAFEEEAIQRWITVLESQRFTF